MLFPLYMKGYWVRPIGRRRTGQANPRPLTGFDKDMRHFGGVTTIICAHPDSFVHDKFDTRRAGSPQHR